MEYRAIDLKEKLGKFADHWVPRVIAGFNDYRIKVVKVQGEFTWHSHEQTDELFLVLDGELQIHFRDGKVNLKTGEMFIVPKGVEHKPAADGECQLMLIEPAGTVNTGQVVNEMTVQDEIWV